MQEVEQKAIQTYENNMDYLKNEDQELFEKINLLNLAIETGQYQEKYILQYRDTYFDILDIKSEKFYYGSNSNDYAKKISSTIDFSKDTQTFSTFYQYNFTDEVMKFYETEDICSHHFVGLAPIINYTNNVLQKNNKFKNIWKQIFFGVGLGTHISEIHNKTKSIAYLIVENDIELFKLSLFVTDYKEISKTSKIFFSITENDYDYKSTFYSFLNHSFVHNHYLKYHLISDAYVDKIKLTQSALTTQTHLMYPFNRKLDELIITLQHLKNKNKFINLNANYKSSIFSSLPVLLVAPGPSLDKSIEWLKANYKKFIIVAPLATVSKLEKHNIKPHLVLHIDARKVSSDLPINQLKDKNFLKDSLFILAANVHRSLLESIKEYDHYLFEMGTNFKEKFGNVMGPSVGDISYALSLIFGTKNLYLLGLDLALDAQTGQRYSESHHNKDKVEIEDEKSISDTAQIHTSTLLVKGNFREKINTTPALESSIYQLNFFTEIHKTEQQKVYNLSDGAYFKQTIPTFTKDVSTKELVDINQQQLQSSLKELFDSYSENGLNKNEISNLKNQLNYAKNIRKIIHTYEQVSVTNEYEYLQNLLTIISFLVGKETKEQHSLFEVYLEYLRSASSFIIDMINTQEIASIQDHIKTIDKIFVKQLYKVVDKYIEAVEELF